MVVNALYNVNYYDTEFRPIPRVSNNIHNDLFRLLHFKYQYSEASEIIDSAQTTLDRILDSEWSGETYGFTVLFIFRF